MKLIYVIKNKLIKTNTHLTQTKNMHNTKQREHIVNSFARTKKSQDSIEVYKHLTLVCLRILFDGFLVLKYARLRLIFRCVLIYNLPYVLLFWCLLHVLFVLYILGRKNMVFCIFLGVTEGLFGLFYLFIYLFHL